jgi:hypothetical protein
VYFLSAEDQTATISRRSKKAVGLAELKAEASKLKWNDSAKRASTKFLLYLQYGEMPSRKRDYGGQ